MRAAVLDRRRGGAEANARGGSIGGQNPSLRTGVIHGGRSVKALRIVGLLGLEPRTNGLKVQNSLTVKLQLTTP